MTDEKKITRYWESIPVFRHEKQARILVQLLQEYFGITTNWERTERGWWRVELPTIENYKTLAIEAFVVGWGRGYEQGTISSVVEKST